MILNANDRNFSPFSLTRLLTTCFGRGNGEKVCILIDLPNPADIEDFKFYLMTRSPSKTTVMKFFTKGSDWVH